MLTVLTCVHINYVYIITQIQRRSHTARINRITHTQHQIRHMFERAQTYQKIVCTSQIPEEIEIFTPSPPVLPTIPSSSELCIHKPLVSAKKSLHSPSTQVSSIKPSSSLNYNEEDVDIPLSMEHMIVKTDNIKVLYIQQDRDGTIV